MTDFERMRDLAAMLDTEARATMTEFGEAERLLGALGRVGPHWVALVEHALSEQSRIDAAVAKERERCAGIVDVYASRIRGAAANGRLSGAFLLSTAGAVERIAAAIRTPTPTTEEGA